MSKRIKDLPLRIIKPPLDLALEEQTKRLGGEKHRDRDEAAGEPSTAVITAVTTPVATGDESAVSSPVATAVNNTDRKRWREQSGFEYLDATHSSSEAKVYSVMYRECSKEGTTERRFGLKELRIKTGLSDKTIRMAIHSLEQKLSIKTIEKSWGIYGRKFRVFTPKEILAARREAGIRIDPATKKIITALPTAVTSAVVTREATANRTTAVRECTPVENTAVTAVNPTGLMVENIINKRNQAEHQHKSSSAALTDNSDFRHKQQTIELYQRYTGNAWKARDEATYQELRGLPIEAIEAGIISSVLRFEQARRARTDQPLLTKINSFAYCVGAVMEFAGFLPPGYLDYLRDKIQNFIPGRGGSQTE